MDKTTLLLPFFSGVIGGLGLFFFGMQFMSEGLKNIAGDKLKKILHMATKIPIIGILAGASVTCLIQSSSATTVIVVGFVNAGLLVLKQAICVVMGANIGTTFTAWIVSSMSVFKITNYALPAIGIGLCLMKLGKTKNTKFWGQTIMGFGLLFIGLSFMKDSFAPLKQSEWIKNIFINLSHNPILGVLTGIIFTILLQSSSATIAIVQILAFNGVIGLDSAIPIILGDNIGTTITAQMASFGANLAAKRTAMSHTLFNVIGTIYMLFLVYTGWFIKIIDFFIPGDFFAINIMVCIAIIHSAFNIINTIVFYPFISWLEKASIWLVPKRKDSIELGPQYLEKNLLSTPSIALEQAKKETIYMLHLAKKFVINSTKTFLNKDKKNNKATKDIENALDKLQSEIIQYLVELSKKNLTEEDAEVLPVLIHSVNDIERIGDHAENITELNERKISENLLFTDEAINHLDLITNEIYKMIEDTDNALKFNNINIAKNVLEREKKINHFQEEIKKNHVNRLSKGTCNIKSGLIFVDFVDNLEKIGDHLTNIAEGIIRKMQWQGIKTK